ncbi:MAG: GNAT family N-acetyltransferase [Bacteroidales bacterium]|nr:GNAT family N-acetyltransferase [Bacteroidales bacterium]
MVTVHKLTHADDAVTERISALLNSLRQASVPLGQARLADLLSKEGFHLFVAKNEEGVIIGMLTLTSCSTLAGDRLWIEDVIVDESRRGHGTGRALLREAISYARNTLKAASIALTSNPSRTAARSLYRSEGFEEYNTGVFRKHL